MESKKEYRSTQWYIDGSIARSVSRSLTTESIEYCCPSLDGRKSDFLREAQWNYHSRCLVTIESKEVRHSSFDGSDF